MSKYYKPQHSRILYLNTSYNCTKSSSITLTKTSGGSGYTSVPTIVVKPASGDTGSGCTATCTLTTGAVNTITVVNNGENYTALPTITTTGGGNPGIITGITSLVGGSGYTSAPTISLTGGGGSGFSAFATLSGSSVGSITITNGGSGYTSAPTIVFTGGGYTTIASASPVLNVGTTAVITPSFNKTYTYTWDVPDIVINDLAKLSAVNIIATGTTATTPYTYRINNLQYDSRDSYFSDYGSPILSIAQTTNICGYGSLGGNEFAIILTQQPIRQISISVDDDITKKGSGQLSSINFVIGLEIEEYDPITTEIGDPYGESFNKLKKLR